MAPVRKTTTGAPRSRNPRLSKESLRERAIALRQEADRLVSAANRKRKASAVESDSTCLSSPGRPSHRSKRKINDAHSSASAARREQLRSGDPMGRHEKFNTESSFVVGRNVGLSADKPQKADNAVRGTKIAAINLGAMSTGELAALLSVYEQAGRAFSSNIFWIGLGPHGFCRADDEADRCASIQRAILEEIAQRERASEPQEADVTASAEATGGKGSQ